MKTKKLCICLMLAAVLTLLFAFTTAFAAEVTLFDKGFKGVYSADRLDVNNWGNLAANDPLYTEGKKWASEWGAEGWYSDGENGLLVHPYVGATYDKEMSIYHKLMAGTLPKDTQLELTYDFNTFDKPESTNGQVWFRLGVTGKSSVLFLLAVSPLDGYTYGFASTTSGYPMQLKQFDRVNGEIKFDYNKNYTVKITIKPDGKAYRFIAEVLEEGKQIGVGLVEQYDGFAEGAFTALNNIHIHCIAKTAIVKQEPIMSVNHIKVKAIYEDSKLDAGYFPKDMSEDIKLNTDAYAQFPMPVETVAIDNVKVSGGADVDDVYLTEDGKRVNVDLSGLKPDTTYEIELKDVKAVGSNKAFDYKWSFTTGNAVSIKNVSMLSESYSEKLNTVDLDNLVSNTDESYLSGAGWSDLGTGSSQEFHIDGDYLYVRATPRENTWSDYKLSRKIEPISDGKSMILKTTIKHLNINTLDYNWTRGASIRIADSENSANNMTLYRPIYSGVFALGMNSSYGTGADTGDEQQITGLAVDTDAEIELVLTPEDDHYRVTLTITQNGETVAVLTRTITTEQAEGFDAIQIWTATMQVNGLYNTFGVKEIKINLGSYALNEGTNTIYFDFENTDAQSLANFEVLVVEHKSETGEGFGTIRNVSVKKFEDIEGAEGSLECKFDVTDAESQIDIYFVNTVDGMNLLSDKIEL